MPSPAYHHTWEAWHVRPHPARVQAARQQGQAPRRRLRISHDSHGGDRRRRIRDAPRQPARQPRQDGHDGRAAGGAARPDAPATEAVVEEKPALLSGPPQLYPDLLRQAAIQGRVVLRAIIDTTGRVEPTSLKIVQSPSPGFDEPTKQWALKALFRPARLHGRAVRSYVNLPFDYSLGS